MKELSWPEVSARRLVRQGLADPVKGASPAELASAMAGVHAQVISAGEHSLALRLDGATRQDVQKALWEEGTLVKTYGPRGTVHLMATRDLPMWVAAMSTIPAGPSGLPEDARLTPEQTEELMAAMRRVLTGAMLTTDELTEALVAATGPWAGEKVIPAFQDMWPRWRQAVGHAANRGAICFGPNRGRKVTFTAPPPFAPVTGRHTLTTAYLHAYGPATPQQFARWLGTSITWATAAFAELELEEVAFDGGRAWVLPGDTEAPQAEAQGVRLLPYFDAYPIAAQPRERLFPGRAWERALNRGQAGNFPVLLLDGVVGGVWHQKRSGKKITITMETLEPLSPAHRLELDDQVARLGEIMDGAPALTLGQVTVGPHA
ncbi:winged helix DNA-binding domain-containing protein [Nonomuraea typhae]|uniref:winged helix DNA-binding domain-containing protein n=1 Tax=Nonomuraea typhae TaxID=2603600 RepID=UPI0012FC9DC9|nr:winged helix DNA-binding domain-containing protein [Nonomuraea typhae]